MNYFMLAFMEPILALRLLDFDLKSWQTGLFFGIWAMTYIPISFTILWLPKKISRRVTIIVCTLLCALAFILAGPSQILKLPESLTLMGIGQALVGAATVGMIVPSLPEMNSVGKRLFIGQEEDVGYFTSGLFCSFLAGG